MSSLPEPSSVLVTGGAGYIGSHAVLSLLEAGHRVTIVDSLARGHREAVEALRTHGDLHFVQADCGDQGVMRPLLHEQSIDTVLHFAAYCYVGESVQEPLRYYANNTGSSLHLLMAVADSTVSRFIFSSTCSTYGEPDPDQLPITESCPQRPINPYGYSKLLVEQSLSAVARQRQLTDRPFACARLRYFNVAGADPAGRVGEDHDPETHLVPICLQAAAGRRDAVTIFGSDYDTPDGTCIRDYVHVSDLVDAHLVAMAALDHGDDRAWNVGTGHGTSVREILASVRRVTGMEVPEVMGDRRPGDPPSLFCDPSRIRDDLGWSARHVELDEIVQSAWEWMRDHPEGYGSAS